MSEAKDGEGAQEIRNDGGLITGAALVGGAKLAYEAGKDVYAWLKTDKELFIQLLDSRYLEKHHVITARFASACAHSLHIEAVSLKDGKPMDIEVFGIHSGDKFGFGAALFDSKDRALGFPVLVRPGAALDVQIKIPEQTDAKVTRDNGLHLVCTFSPVDKLGAPEMVSTPIRLRWA